MSNFKRETKTAYVSVRMNESVKNAAEKVFDELGISTSEAVNIFFKEVTRVGGIPFEIANPYARLVKVER